MKGMPLISLVDLAISFVPVVAVLVIYIRWSLDYKTVLYGMGRMLGQLLAIGYLLNIIFNSDSVWVVLMVMSVMVLAAGWIGLRTLPYARRQLYPAALGSILTGGVLTFSLVVGGVLSLDPWYAPRFTIPLAGMIFASSMTIPLLILVISFLS